VSDETPEERARQAIERMAMSDCNEVDLARDVLALSAEVDHLHRQRVDLADELAEVSDECDRLRHGEKVRDDELAEAFIRGFEAGAERPEDAGDGDAMGQAFRDWRSTTDEVAVLAALIPDEENMNEPIQHQSDCSLHNGPALPTGPCDCAALDTEG
jgi:hypothetical protein